MSRVISHYVFVFRLLMTRHDVKSCGIARSENINSRINFRDILLSTRRQRFERAGHACGISVPLGG